VTTPYLGEIRMLSFNFAPRGWALCNGATLTISQNQALFAVLGTIYGGDGVSTFCLPDLRVRMPLHANDAYPLGRQGGEVNHILTTDEIPAHTHRASASSAIANTVSPTSAVWANTGKQSYAPAPNGFMDPSTVTVNGLSQAHQNMPPFLVINFVIALQGIFPQRDPS
jgi:microcystin-dependent protein